MILRPDCGHFPGDRPCKFNKLDGRTCENCSEYFKYETRILIIKLDALGDVLRTTSLIPAVKKAWPSSHITWVTKKNAMALFNNLNDVQKVLDFDEASTHTLLLSSSYDILIHPDASPQSAPLASLVKAGVKKGYLMNPRGFIEPADAAAVEWFEMGAFDNIKKVNTKSYQQVIHEICGLPYEKGEIQLKLSANEIAFAQRFREEHDLSKYKRLVGLNTGASGRWQLKQWRYDGYSALIERLLKIEGTGILLYGGREEEERNRALKNDYPEVIDTGYSNTLREFFALMSLPDVVVTGDTMALHAAAALQKKVVCLFGPTSYHEIEDYGRITKIYPGMDCLVCYKQTCDFVPNCMDLISVDMVYDAVLKDLQ